MISGAHMIIYSTDPDADRAFFRDVLGFANVDAGGGWLIFALPPAEVAVHPAEENGRRHLVGARFRSGLGPAHRDHLARRRQARPLPAAPCDRSRPLDGLTLAQPRFA